MKQHTLPRLACLLLALVLTGCAPRALPDGMEEDAVIEAGQEIVELLVGGKYQETAALFREDINVSADTVQNLMEDVAGDLGFFLGRRDVMATGRTVDGVEYGEAVILCEYKKDDVLFRVCFDTDMILVGLEITKQ